MRLSSTNSLIENALKQMDSSSNDANKAMVSAKLQFAILAARLVKKQADNDAMFRATAELAHTNVSLQNELEGLQEKLETLAVIEKTESNKVEEETPEAVESNVAIDATFKKQRQGAKTRMILPKKSKVNASVESTILPSPKPKSSSPVAASVELKNEVLQADDSWGWNEDAVEEPTETATSTTSDDSDSWGGNKSVEVSAITEAVPSEAHPQVEQPAEVEWKEWDEKIPDAPKPAEEDASVYAIGTWNEESTRKPKTKKPKTVKKPVPVINETPASPDEDQSGSWGWDDKPSASKKSSKPPSREPTPSPLTASQQSAQEQWGNKEESEEKDSKVVEWAWNDEPLIEEPKRSASRASSTISKTSKASTTKNSHPMSKKPAPPPPTTSDDWGWGDEEAEVEEPVKTKSNAAPRAKKSQPKPKSDDWGWDDNQEEEASQEATDDWGW